MTDPTRFIPPGVTITSIEVMSPSFTKFHLSDGHVLHHFTQAEPDSDPHDHAMSIDIEVLAGGYVEQVFSRRASGWSTAMVQRQIGTKHRIRATHIHRIVELPHGECWTRARYGPHERETRFWRKRDGRVESRAWHEGWVI